MTKGDLIEKVAKDAGIPKSAAENALNATLDSIKTALKKGQKVTLVGFGAFSVTKSESEKRPQPQDRSGDQDTCHESPEVLRRRRTEESR